MEKLEFYKRYGNGERILEVEVGYEVGIGYYVRGTPMKIGSYKGTETRQYSGFDIKDKVIIPSKKYSEKKWQEFMATIDETVNTCFMDEPLFQNYIKGV